MINKWILDNFKSINHEIELTFRPLTVFTGANSSGKSTVLQSILLVTQTLQSPFASRSLVLNGWFKKFGTYSDIVNKRDYKKNITIGFSLSTNDIDSRKYFISRYSRYYSNSEFDGTECSFIISSDGKDDNIQPILENMNLYFYVGEAKYDEIEILKAPQKTKEEDEVIAECNDLFPPSDLVYLIKEKDNKHSTNVLRQKKMKPIGLGLYHFLPRYRVVYRLYKDQIKESLSDYLLSSYNGNFSIGVKHIDEDIITPLIKNKALDIVNKISENNKFVPRFNNLVQGKYKDKIELINDEFTISRFRDILKDSTIEQNEKENYVNSIVDLLDNLATDYLPTKYIPGRVPYHHLGVDIVNEFFNDHIMYLGPLREEPKSLYPLVESNSSTSELGLKGENTASVFENNKFQIIDYITPDFYENGASGNPSPIQGSLATAINKWLVYLGVAKNISTNDKGKYGHELKITTDIKEMEQDLTHVGVGVSQILPILVLCFLSKKGDTIILEQPELHLHPKVQTRLADFFVSMNALGKQCIIETHSEYLINRLRYLVAVNEDSMIADQTMIYFVEKDDEGCSKYRQITINPYGVIEQWPDGFFDEGEDLATKIVKAGMEKRRREQKKNKG